MRLPLAERSILLVEDEPIIALEVLQGLQDAGASVLRARTVGDALLKVETPELSAAVLDHGLKDGDSSQVCERLDAKRIPFVVYSGYEKVKGPCSQAEHVQKPVPLDVLVQKVIELLSPGGR